MAKIELDLEEFLSLLKAGDTKKMKRSSRKSSKSVAGPKKKRKASAYQMEVGRQMKRLKKAHPRTPMAKLMKRAHTAAKKKRKGRRK